MGAGGAEQRRQRRLGNGMPFRICLADSSDGTPRGDFLFPPPCGSERPHAGAGAGASVTIPQCQSSHAPAMFWQIRSPGRRRDVVDWRSGGPDLVVFLFGNPDDDDAGGECSSHNTARKETILHSYKNPQTHPESTLSRKGRGLNHNKSWFQNQSTSLLS